MENNGIENKTENFSVTKRVKSFAHAGRGIAVFLKNTHNAWLHVAALVFVLLLGWYFHITSTEWILVSFAVGLVFTAEAFNTAIEIDIDLTSPEYHPYAKDTKDVAAGAVLIAAMTALAVGLIIFVPYILK